MKKMSLLLILLLTFSTVLFAQTDATSDSLNSTFTATGKALTDEQAKAANEFVHQGIKDEKIKEGCAKDSMQGCTPSPTDEGVIFKGGLGAALENNISKLYTVVFGGMNFIGGGSSAAKASTKMGADGKPVAPKEKKTDYCIYAAMAGEVVAQGMQSAGQSASQAATANLNDPQVQALANLKDTHKTRKKTATLQSAIYGAVTACYAVRMFTGGPTDTMTIIKMGAAAGISMLYKMKADKHAKAMKVVQGIIDGLPKAGDCNPYTGTTCFCKEATSKTLYASQYQEVCVLNGGNADGTLTTSGCAETKNGVVVYDGDCSCQAQKTCFTTTVSSYNPSFPLGSNFMAQANKGFDLVEAGTFDEGKLNQYTTDTNALYNKIKDKGDASNVPKVTLTDDQKKTASDLSKIMPASVAALGAAAASSSPHSGGLMDSSSKSALDKLPAGIKKQLEAEISGGYSSKGGGSDSNNVAADAPFVMPKFGGAEESSESGSEVVSFANKAIDGAEVSNRPDAAIFDIISNRYRASGWNRVQLETPP